MIAPDVVVYKGKTFVEVRDVLRMLGLWTKFREREIERAFEKLSWTAPRVTDV